MSKRWFQAHQRDTWRRQARSKGYRARSAFKLKQIQEKFHLIREGDLVLDVGCHPGGWAQVSSKIITAGKILSLDIKKMEQLKNVSFLQCNFLEEGTKEKILKFFREKLDVVLSDMAANTTGNKSLDCIRTNQLCADVVEFSSKILKPNGVLVSKLFMGEDFLEVKELAKSRFKKVSFFKPEASRNESKETYLHCVTLRTL